jgi:ABC-type sugar transport system substrate-binding protein
MTIRSAARESLSAKMTYLLRTLQTEKADKMKSVSNWFLIVLAVSVLTGCAKGPATNRATAVSQGDAITVCLLPKIKGIAYFSSCAEGAREAAEELGNIELIYDGPTDGDPRKQAEMIENWTVDGVDVICVSPNAPDVVAAAMRDARAAGVKVITWDADAGTDTRSFFVNQATAESIGQGLVQAMLDDLGGPDAEGDVVIISSDATSDNQNSWIAAMKPALDNSKLNLATIKYPGENAANALADSKDVIKKYPNLKGIFGISSVSFPGAAEAVEQSAKSGEILVTGLSTPNDIKRFVHNGTVKTVVLWNTVDLGYLTVRVAEALVTGKLDSGATAFSAGRLGDVEIAGDHVLLGEILRFTAENIDEYDF